MTKVVYKYELGRQPVQVLLLPRGVQALSVAEQNFEWFLWALVDPTQTLVKTQVLCLGTGHEAPEDIEKFYHVSTFQEGRFVWHFFLQTQD